MKPLLTAILITLTVALTSLTCPRGSADCDDDLMMYSPPQDACDELRRDNWTKFENNPVFNKGEEGEWDENGVTCFVVRHFPWEYMMWYSVGGGGHFRGFGLATSEDGIEWERHDDNPVMAPDSGVTVWGPEVLHDGELYHMWYVSRGPDMNGISYCTSEDGVEWTQSENNPVIDHGGCNAVVWDGEQYRMFLQHSARREHGFQLLTSDDGEQWEVQGFPFHSGPRGTWDEITAAPSVGYYEDRLHLWYTGADTVGNRRGEIAIGHAMSENWGDEFIVDNRNRDRHRELRPTERWEGRGLYSSGVDYDGENVYIWYAATGPDGGFGYASRPVNAVKPETELKETLNLWSLSPNPTSGSVKLNYMGTMDVGVTVGIFDLNGRRLTQQQFSAYQPIRLNPVELDLPIGQYLIKIEARGKEIHKRMVLVK